MLFVSKKRDLRVIIKPSDLIMDDKKRPIIVRGFTAEFHAGRFFTDDPEIIAALLQNKAYGMYYVSAETEEECQRFLDSHPEYKNVIDNSVTKMNRGMSGTVPSTETRKAMEEMITAPTPKKEIDLDSLIAEAVAKAVAKAIPTIMEAVMPQGQEPPKPKRQFQCKACNELFPTGIALGEHKKVAHVT